MEKIELEANEVELIWNNMERMEEQLARLYAELGPRSIAIDISRLRNAALFMKNQTLECMAAMKSAEARRDGEALPNADIPDVSEDSVEHYEKLVPDDFVSAYDAADIFKVTLRTLYKRLKDGSLPAKKILGKWYIKKSVINELFGKERV